MAGGRERGLGAADWAELARGDEAEAIYWTQALPAFMQRMPLTLYSRSTGFFKALARFPEFLSVDILTDELVPRDQLEATNKSRVVPH